MLQAYYLNKTICSMGSLGGGNHFIEIDQSEDKTLYAVIHSGSRNLGKSVAEYYMRAGQDALKEQGIEVPYELNLTGQLLEDYLHDQWIVTPFAYRNLEEITGLISDTVEIQQILKPVYNFKAGRIGSLM